MKPRIYTDTSVIGGCLDTEFAPSSLQLFENFKSGSAIIVVSNLTLLELENAPEMVQAVLKEVPVENIEYVEFTKEGGELAQIYISEGIIGEKNRVDAQHIATATISRVDVLVSWNFKHIVNLQRIHAYNAVNLKYGYPLLEIRTPQEVISYGEE
jgi:predicted nucleic acid-binding protein